MVKALFGIVKGFHLGTENRRSNAFHLLLDCLYGCFCVFLQNPEQSADEEEKDDVGSGQSAGDCLQTV